MSKFKHIPVMLKEVIENLKIKKSGIYLDLTSGYGGHSKEILKRISQGFLLCFDKDKEAIKHLEQIFGKERKNLKIYHQDYKYSTNILRKLEMEKIDGALLDLGVSSPQIDSLARGFSYQKNCQLDMRMDRTQSLDAKTILNSFSASELVKIFKDYGEITKPLTLVKNIINQRPLETSFELIKIIYKSFPGFYIRKKNPKKQVFQALRIAVNGELKSLNIVMQELPSFLKRNASILIITFHSLEEKIIKSVFRNLTKSDLNPKFPNAIKSWKLKKILPSAEEIKLNKRSRTAKLWVLTKLGG